MDWDDFYERFFDWAPSTRKRRISSQKEFGPGSEVVDLAYELNVEEAESFIKKAIKYGVQFDSDDYMNLSDIVSNSFLFELMSNNIAAVNIDDLDNIFDDFETINKLIQMKMKLDDSTMSWDYYFEHVYEMNSDDRINYLAKIDRFGPTNEIVDVISYFDEDEAGLLVDMFHKKGVRFSKEDILELLYYVNEDKRLELGLQYRDYFSIEEIDEHFEGITDTEEMYKYKYDESDRLTEAEIKILKENEVDFDLHEKAPDHLNTFEWDEFYEKVFDWDDERVVERFRTLKHLGPASEILEVADYLVKDSDRDIIIGRALDAGVRFKKNEVLELLWDLSPAMNYKLLKEHLDIIPFNDLMEITRDVDNFKDLVIEKVSKVQNINLEAIIEYGDNKLLKEVLKKMSLTSHNQSALYQNYDYIPSRLKRSLMNRLKRSNYVNKKLYSQLEFDLLSSRKQKKLLKKQANRNSISLLELIGLGAIAKLFQKKKKVRKPSEIDLNLKYADDLSYDQESESTWKWKHYDDLEYDQESGTYVEKK